MTKTVGRMIDRIRELGGRAAVNRAAASYMRLRYLSRDDDAPRGTIRNADGTAVSLEVIESELLEWEEQADDLDEQAENLRNGVVTDGA